MIRSIVHQSTNLTAAQLRAGQSEAVDCYDVEESEISHPWDTPMTGSVILASVASIAPVGTMYAVSVVDYVHRERTSRTFTKLLDARQALHEGIGELTKRFGWVDPQTGEEHEPWCNHDAAAVHGGVCECGLMVTR